MRVTDRILPPGAPWIDNDLYMHVGTNTMQIVPGSRQRGLPCIACRRPAGDEQCHMVVIVAGILCPTDNSHLNAAGLFCHARCMPKKEARMARLVAEALRDMKH